ncbi:MAG: PD-(D/E)XK nuclease family protein [Planctomycetota bacterium]|nr:PD-(D/E)XK nuclease family protein [Planctomycetota bacterium]
MGDEAEKIMFSGDGVLVLTAPARSGKTAAAIDLYLRCRDEIGRPGCLLIVPNAPAVAQARSLLLEWTGGVLIAPAVTTFARLAGSILALAGKSPATLSRHQRLMLLERIIDELHADGQLRALGSLVDTSPAGRRAPGLVGVLDASIAELKRAAVEPDALAEAIDPESGRDASLLAIYRRYQQHLLDTGRFDVEGQMWLARDVLSGDEKASLGYENITTVVADGFTDLTPTQMEMLALLGRRVSKILITLPLVEDGRRGRLWFWTARTLERIKKAIPSARIITIDNEHEPLRTLFDLTGGTGVSPVNDTGETPMPPITVLEAPDIEAEVRATARSVKADLVAGAEPGTIAVVARNLEAYTEPINRIFAAHSIGVAPRAARLDTCGPVRYILSLLALRREYEFNDLLAVIKNSYFRPESLGKFDAGSVAVAEMVIRAAGVLGGRESYGRAFARLARRARDKGDEFDSETIELGPLMLDAETIEKSAEMIEALMASLDGLSAASDAGEYVEAVRSLMDSLGIHAAAARHEDDSLVAADLRALSAFDELLDDASSSELSTGGGTGCLQPVFLQASKQHGLQASRATPGDMADVISHAAAEATCPPERTESAVTVLDALDVRAIRCKHLYLLGVNEKAFPQLSFDRCFITESDRTEWGRRGVVLDRRSDLIGREMLLFYLTATRADERLTVSYLSADGAGEPGAFVEELISAAGREGIEFVRKRVGPGQFVPPTEEIASPSDAFAAAISAAFDGSEQTDALLGFAARNYTQLLGRASFGLVAAHRRWSLADPDEFDGRINSPELLKTLAEQIPGQWVFSASELNSYAACAWRFFARYLLGLTPLIVPAAQLAPADRGLFCHAVLWRVMTRLRQRNGGTVRLAEIDPNELKDVLADACRAEKQRLADRAIYSQLWDAQTSCWQRMLGDYLSDQRETFEQHSAESIHFELGFGLGSTGLKPVPPSRDEEADPASRPDPVELEAGEHRIRLRGRIDRLDRIVMDDKSALLAVDYKSGRVPDGKDIVAGLDLQLALYARALEAMFDLPAGQAGLQCAGGVYHSLRDNKHRYFATFKVPQVRGLPKQEYEELLAGAMEATGRYVQAMREGVFDAIPSGKCSKWCPYRQICHYSPARARRKEAYR